MARERTIVSGTRTGIDGVGPVDERLRDRCAAGRLAAHEADRRPLDEPDRGQLVEALGQLREERPRRDRRDDDVGQAPAELLGDLEGQRLAALGVERAAG